jgi:hypothetical protein
LDFIELSQTDFEMILSKNTQTQQIIFAYCKLLIKEECKFSHQLTSTKQLSFQWSGNGDDGMLQYDEYNE